MSAADVAVIIVNWKVRELLRSCIESIHEASGLLAGSTQIIVVDNDSGDGSSEMVRAQFPDVMLISNRENVGFGQANNQALALTEASTLILLNPDTLVQIGALAGMVSSLYSDPTVGLVGCRLLNKDGSLQRWTAGAFPRLSNVLSHYFFIDRILPRSLRPAPLYLDRDISEPIDVDWVSGACMAIRRDALQGQLFDPRFFMYAEDMELCHRLRHTGWRVRYDPRISVVHFQGESLRQQKTDVMLSSLESPRHFFEMTRGKTAARVFDIIVLAGFALRWMLYGLAVKVVARPEFSQRFRSSRCYLGLAWRILKKNLVVRTTAAQ